MLVHHQLTLETLNVILLLLALLYLGLVAISGILRVRLGQVRVQIAMVIL